MIKILTYYRAVHLHKFTMSRLFGIYKTEFFTSYLRKVLANELTNGPNIQIPDCPEELLEELHYVIILVKRAIKNKSKWHIRDLIVYLLYGEYQGQCVGRRHST